MKEIKPWNELLIIDLDNTLIPTGYRYHLAGINAATIINAALGYYSLDPLEIFKKMREIDLKALKSLKTKKFSLKRFSNSWVKTYKWACGERNIVPKERMIKKITEAASQFALPPFQVFPEAKETLAYLKNKGHRLYLLTMGPKLLQNLKITKTGLKIFFERIYIVSQTKTKKLRQIKKQFKFKNNIYMIGDSSTYDIQAALDAGIKPIHIPFGGWYEDIKIPDPVYLKKVILLNKFSDLQKIF